MFEQLFIGFGFMALVVTIVSMLAMIDRETQLVLSLMAFVMWAVWALQAGAVRAPDGSTETYTSLMFVGALFALMMVVSALINGLDLIREA